MKTLRMTAAVLVALVIGMFVAIAAPDSAEAQPSLLDEGALISITASTDEMRVGEEVVWYVTVSNWVGYAFDMEATLTPPSNQRVVQSPGPMTDKDFEASETVTYTFVTEATSKGLGVGVAEVRLNGVLHDMQMTRVQVWDAKPLPHVDVYVADDAHHVGGTGGGYELADTGTEVANLVGLGGTLIVVGAGAVVLGRKRFGL